MLIQYHLIQLMINQLIALEYILMLQQNRDVTTGLKTKTHAGRPNWEKVFKQLQDQNHGDVTVFYCGLPQLASTLQSQCEEIGFKFRKEVF